MENCGKLYRCYSNNKNLHWYYSFCIYFFFFFFLYIPQRWRKRAWIVVMCEERDNLIFYFLSFFIDILINCSVKYIDVGCFKKQLCKNRKSISGGTKNTSSKNNVKPCWLGLEEPNNNINYLPTKIINYCILKTVQDIY